MKIANAKTILLSMPFEAGGTPPWSFGGKPANSFDILLVRLETNDGLVGWGEAFSRCAQADDGHAVIAADPRERRHPDFQDKAFSRISIA
jgi:L-alanine-DL-glutamate epimerase-like enolase superfamily enzyme